MHGCLFIYGKRAWQGGGKAAQPGSSAAKHPMGRRGSKGIKAVPLGISGGNMAGVGPARKAKTLGERLAFLLPIQYKTMMDACQFLRNISQKTRQFGNYFQIPQ